MTTFSAFDDRDRFEQYLRDHYTAIVGRAGKKCDCPLATYALHLGIVDPRVGGYLTYVDPESGVERSDLLTEWQSDFIEAIDNRGVERFREGAFAPDVFLGKDALAVLASIPKE